MELSDQILFSEVKQYWCHRKLAAEAVNQRLFINSGGQFAPFSGANAADASIQCGDQRWSSIA
jgi:hypothetical protein